MRRVRAKAVKEKGDPASYTVVVDLGGRREQVGWDVCHCLTRNRGSEDAFFSLQHQRFMSIRELGRLQGLCVDRMKINVSRAQIGAMLGNGFTSTVVARVVAAAIQSAEGSAVASECPATGRLGYDTPSCQPQAAQPQAAGQPQAAPVPVRITKRRKMAL